MVKTDAPPNPFALSLLHAPPQWLDTSEVLWCAAEQLLLCAEAARPRHHRASVRLVAAVGKAGKPHAPIEELPPEARELALAARRQYMLTETYRPASMLRAMSIEADFKAGYYTKQLEIHGHVTRIRTYVTHDLNQLAADTKFPLVDGDKRLLKSLTLMITRGRYPVAWENTPAGRKYHYNFSTSPGADAELRERVREHSTQLWTSLLAAKAKAAGTPQS